MLMLCAMLAACSIWQRSDQDGLDLLKQQHAQWQSLAAQGQAEAQYRLGMSYCCGNGAGHSDALTGYWLCRAAMQGHRGAQFQLGRWYGWHLQKRLFFTDWEYPAYAHFWYSLAAAQGDELAATYRDALERDMTERQIEHSLNWQQHPGQIRCD
jgi:uncharacterized protein